MNSNVTTRTVKELDTLATRYALFLSKFRDVALDHRGDAVYLKLSPKEPGHNRLYAISCPGSEFLEVF
jgi:hypothetical protein